MTRDFMQSASYAAWGSLGVVVWAKAENQLPQLIARAKAGEGEFRAEDLEQAAMDATLLTEEETNKILFFVTAARERAAFLAKQAGNPRSRQS